MFGSWVSRVLCLIPDSFSSLGLSRKRTWLMHKKLFRSCSYPCGHWSGLNTPCYLCGWASSLSAADLLLLSEEELVHCCHHVLVQINTHVWVQINKIFVCCMLWVQPLFSVLCQVHVCMGNVQKLGLILGEHRSTSSKRGCTSEQGRLRLGLSVGGRQTTMPKHGR